MPSIRDSDVKCKVVLIVPNHSITGEVSLGVVRLSDWLNDSRISFMDVHNAEFARLSNPGKAIHQSSRAVVPKAQVIIAFEVDQGAHAAPQRLYAYRKKRTYPVFLATGDMEVRGFLHSIPSETGPDLTMMRPERFIPVTSAVVSICGMEAYSIRRESVLVHIQEIDYFSVGDVADIGK